VQGEDELAGHVPGILHGEKVVQVFDYIELQAPKVDPNFEKRLCGTCPALSSLDRSTTLRVAAHVAEHGRLPRHPLE